MNNTINITRTAFIAGLAMTSLLAFTPKDPPDVVKQLSEQATPLTQEQLNTKVPHFYCFDYHFDPQPGKRYWLRVSSTRWIERYPDGLETRFKILGHTTVKGAQGTLVVKVAGDTDKIASDNAGSLLAFIPDKGNEVMHHWFRHTRPADDDWHDLAKMQSIE